MIDEVKNKNRRVNYYLVLDIGAGASHNEILHAYNRAKNTYSGGALASYTLMDEGDSSSIMEDIEEAFLTLGNPAKRREYDMDMGFNTWSEDAENKPEDINAADLLGAPKKTKPQSPAASSVQTAAISPIAASIASMGDMSFDSTTPLTATVIQMKPQNSPSQVFANTTAPAPKKKGHSVGGVEYEPNPEFEKQMANCESVTGEFIKAVRIYRRYTPEALALRCKLSTAHVLTFENEDTTQMHQPVYLRGHIYLLCHALDLPNPDRLAKKFVERMMDLGKIQKKLF